MDIIQLPQVSVFRSVLDVTFEELHEFLSFRDVISLVLLSSKINSQIRNLNVLSNGVGKTRRIDIPFGAVSDRKLYSS